VQGIVKHFASPDFWDCYHRLPQAIRELADKNYGLLKANPRHSSLHLKQVGDYWSVRVGSNYQALAITVPGGFVWFWIGKHDEYDRLIR
jgi:hypothetical protein